MNGALKLTSVTDPADVPLLLNGWRPRAYRLQTEALHLTRAYIELAPGLSVQEVRLESGALRIDGVIGAGLLKIGFIKTKEIRILGNCVNDSVMAIAYGGSRLNFTANFPGSALSVHFGPAMARRVLADDLLPVLLRRLEGPSGLETLLYPVTPAGRMLLRSASGLLGKAAPGSAIANGAAEPVDPDDIVDMGAELVEEVLGANLALPGANAARRRELALAVENILWECPQTGGIRRMSLDDAARRLHCSRRSIQLALQEEFGLGFVALKRSIRLQQVHAILKSGQSDASGIGRIARAHEFNHLSRFASHYREMFGVLPSLEAPPTVSG